eukprot:s1238_g27.t1
MKGLSQADVQLTVKCLRYLPDDHQGLMRCALNGTQYTHDALSHAGVVETDTCRFCQSRDSLYHRTWECPFFQDLRNELPALPDPTEVPQCTACHGWLPISPHLARLRHMFLTLPDTTTSFCEVPLACQTRFVDLFLGGSCVHPTEPDLRVASWAVVVWDGADFQLLSDGIVSGWRQTSLRAELTAAISALKFSVDQQCPCRLWFDNESVQGMLQQWIQGFDPPWEHRQDADLWYQLHAQFQHASPFLHAALKVQAHACVLRQDTPMDAWAVLGSITADMFAAEGRQKLPAEFWQVWTAVRILMLATMEVSQFPKHLQAGETFHALTWVRSLVDTAHGIQWVSYHQLLIDYQKYTRRLGPYTTGRKWTARGIDVIYKYPQQVQWFGRFLQNLAKAAGEALHTDRRRPSSLVIAFWCGCLQVAMHEDRLSAVDSQYRDGVRSLPARQIGRDMADVITGECVAVLLTLSGGMLGRHVDVAKCHACHAKPRCLLLRLLRVLLASSRSQWALPDFICQLWALPDFICQLQIALGTAGLHLPAPDRSGHRLTSAATARSQWALPDFSRDCQIAVATAGLQPRAPDLSGHCGTSAAVGTAGLQPRLPDPSGRCRTSTATARSQWALPDFSRELQMAVGTAGLQLPNRDCQISVGTAGLQPRAPDGSGHCRTSAASSRFQIECRIE